MKRIVILGGGVGGLSTGWMLSRSGRYEVTIIENAPVVGGVCGTFRYEDYILDYGPHKLYSVIPGILDEMKVLMRDELLHIEKISSIYMFGSFLDYPVRMSEIAVKMGIKNLVQCGLSSAGTLFRRNKTGNATESYEDYLVNIFGRKMYELVFKPLADKTWGDPSTLSADIARTRIPAKNPVDLVMRAAGLRKESDTTDAAYFYYPRRGFGRIPERMAEEIVRSGGAVLTGTEPVKISGKDFTISDVQIKCNNTVRSLSCDILISSIPLDILVTLFEVEHGEMNDAIEAAKRLQYRSVFLVYIILDRNFVTDRHWIFFPERDVVFGRIFEQKQMSSDMVPVDRTVLCCDITDYEEGALRNCTDKQLAEMCVSDLVKIGIIDKKWVKNSFVKRFPRFYPRYDVLYRETITELYSALKNFDNLLLTGRIGFYNYNNCDHCVDMGKFIAENLDKGKHTREIWNDLETRVREYRIVD